MINQGTKRLNTIKDKGAGSIPKNGGKINKNIGRDVAAKIDAKDTYPVKMMVKIAIIRQKGKTVGNSAISIPPSVATPLPPLNLEKIV